MNFHIEVETVFLGLAAHLFQQVMGPDTLNNLNMSSNNNTTTLAVPKLHDNGSNWSDYLPRLQNAKGLWRHADGTATAPVPFAVSNGIPMLSDGKTSASEDQIEFKKREYLACHILLSTTSTCLRSKIKNLATTKDMWKVIKEDATLKSMLYILDTGDQLSSMKLIENDDTKTHLLELKQHFQLMLQRRDNLIKIGSTMSESHFIIIVMLSLPQSYQPTLQTLTANR